jgi:hypothetical protein
MPVRHWLRRLRPYQWLFVQNEKKFGAPLRGRRGSLAGWPSTHSIEARIAILRN